MNTPTSSVLTWHRIQALYDLDGRTHWMRCQSAGLECPWEVFEQLFHGEAQDAPLTAYLRAVDWARVRFELEEFSGIKLRGVGIDRIGEHAVDEARERTASWGVQDARPEVLDHWREMHSWLVPPVMADGAVLGSALGIELLVGRTRLGNLLGLLDREEIPETHRHLVWVARVMGPA